MAVTEDDCVRGEVRLASSEGHSRRLLPAVDFLLHSLGLRPGDVEAFAVTTGPETTPEATVPETTDA